LFTVEAIRLAMEIHGTKDVTRAMVRDGFEQLKLGAEDFERLGIEGFIPSVDITCANHSGAGLVAVKQWDASTRTWQQISDFYEPDMALIAPQVEQAASAFAESAGMTSRRCS
jgi:branched-chain amino acid transport system substrate-binding protein